MLNKRLLCIIISFILGFMPILQYFPVFAAENAVIEENLTLCIQMIKEEDGDFKKNGNAEYVSGLQIDDCVLIDLEWISDKLGLLMQITDAEKKIILLQKICLMILENIKRDKKKHLQTLIHKKQFVFEKTRIIICNIYSKLAQKKHLHIHHI